MRICPARRSAQRRHIYAAPAKWPRIVGSLRSSSTSCAIPHGRFKQTRTHMRAKQGWTHRVYQCPRGLAGMTVAQTGAVVNPRPVHLPGLPADRVDAIAVGSAYHPGEGLCPAMLCKAWLLGGGGNLRVERTIAPVRAERSDQARA